MAVHDSSIPTAPTGDPVGPATTGVESLRAAQAPVTPPHNSPISFSFLELNSSETSHTQTAMAPKKNSASQTSEAPVEAGELGAALLESRITAAGVDKVRYLAAAADGPPTPIARPNFCSASGSFQYLNIAINDLSSNVLS